MPCIIFVIQIIQTSTLGSCEFFIRCPSSALAPDHVWPLVDFWHRYNFNTNEGRNKDDGTYKGNTYEDGILISLTRPCMWFAFLKTLKTWRSAEM